MASCATPSSPAAPEQPKPAACDPRLTAEVEGPPDLPKGASILSPVGSVEVLAVRLFLQWAGDLSAHDRDMTARARLAKADCARR